MSMSFWYGIANQIKMELRFPLLFSAAIYMTGCYSILFSTKEEYQENVVRAKYKVRKDKKKNEKLDYEAASWEAEPSYNFAKSDFQPVQDFDTTVVMKRQNGIIFNSIDTVFDFYSTLKNLVINKCDGETHHLLHVAEYVRIICLHMGMTEEKALLVAKASLLHDIGKICIPQDVLLKTQALSEEEYSQIRRHNIYGFNMLNDENDRFLKMASRIAREHHENYNGTGYLGLKGDEINIYARIVTVADVFDAVTANRIYKKAWSFDEGVEYIVNQSGDYFDPDIVAVFSSCKDEIHKVYESFKMELVS